LRTFRKYFKLNITKIEVPWLGSIEFAPNTVEKQAAYDIYIELTTRVTTQRLPEGQGMLREALTSLRTMFDFIRSTLHEAGLDSAYELGPVALAILNKGLRPFTAKWHPLLQVHESKKPAEVSAFDHEQSWEHAPQMRRELYELQDNLRLYAGALAKVAGVDKDIHAKFMDEHTH
jgi:hypothetical protein